MLDKTMIFSLGEEKDDQIKAGLTIYFERCVRSINGKRI